MNYFQALYWRIGICKIGGNRFRAAHKMRTFYIETFLHNSVCCYTSYFQQLFLIFISKCHSHTSAYSVQRISFIINLERIISQQKFVNLVSDFESRALCHLQMMIVVEMKTATFIQHPLGKFHVCQSIPAHSLL